MLFQSIGIGVTRSIGRASSHVSDRVAAAHVQAERLKAAVWIPNYPIHVPVI